MKINCKASIKIDTGFSFNWLKINIKIKQPYKSIFRKIKYKSKETYVYLITGNKYEIFLNECIEYLNKEGVKEEMLKYAIDTVEKYFGVSEKQIEIKNKENELNGLIDKFSFEFDMEV